MSHRSCGFPLLSPARPASPEGCTLFARNGTVAPSVRMERPTRTPNATDTQAARNRLRLRLRFGPLLAAAIGLCTTAMVAPGHAEPPKKCGADGILTEQGKIIGGGGVQPDLVIDTPCQVLGTKPYYFGNVNIISGGKLIFIEPPVEPTTEKTQDLWATAIIIENGGEMYAGVDYPGQLASTKAYGTNGRTHPARHLGYQRRG
jgi:hypothetical protein